MRFFINKYLNRINKCRFKIKRFAAKHSDKKIFKNVPLGKAFKRFIIGSALILIIAFGIIFGAVYGYIKSATPLDKTQLSNVKANSRVYDSNKKEIYKITSTENRDWVTSDKISNDLKDSFIATEDKRFRDHSGVDYKGMVAALLSQTLGIGESRGGSTITMQLVKNITGNDSRSLPRKVQEMYLARQLEKELNKDEILEKYLNTACTGLNIYGVKTAAKTYFNKDLDKDKLTLAECACIAGITQYPTKYAPVTDESKASNLKKQKSILQIMLDEKFITKAEYDKAIKETVKFIKPSKTTEQKSSTQSYFVDAVITDLTADLARNGKSEQQAKNIIYNGGLKIYTTMDPTLQKSMDSVFTNPENFPDRNTKGLNVQGSMVVIDSKTGEVKALYGGYGVKKDTDYFNRAVDSKRSPGSCFKPISIYGPAIDSGKVTAATVIDDVPVHLNDQEPTKLYPQNASRIFSGLVTVRNALIQSLNVPAVKLWMENQETSIEYLNKSGYNFTVDKAYNGFPIGSGVTTNPKQLAAAYVPFVNKGVYLEPLTYTKVLDIDGNVLIDKTDKKNTPDLKQKQTKVYSPQSARVMTRLLENVCSLGTAAGTTVTNKNGVLIPTGGKTGSTDNGDKAGDVDKWFVGLTPYYVGAVWYGDEANKGIVSYGSNPSIGIWKKVMTAAHANSKPVPFDEPENIVKVNVCKYSGLLPSDACSKDPRKDAVIEEYFVAGTEPTAMCTTHVASEICTSATTKNKYYTLATDKCPKNQASKVGLIKRPIPFTRQYASDPLPADWKYELNPNAKCTIHEKGVFDADYWRDLLDPDSRGKPFEKNPFNFD